MTLNVSHLITADDDATQTVQLAFDTVCKTQTRHADVTVTLKASHKLATCRRQHDFQSATHTKLIAVDDAVMHIVQLSLVKREKQQKRKLKKRQNQTRHTGIIMTLKVSHTCCR